MVNNNPVYWSNPSGADSKPSVNLSFQGDEAVQWIFNILVSIGTYTDKHDEKAALHGWAVLKILSIQLAKQIQDLTQITMAALMEEEMVDLKGKKS